MVNHKKLPNIKCFTYVFPCDFAKKNNEVEIFGTGGMILQNMKNLLYNLPGLETLELVDLQLDGHDGMIIVIPDQHHDHHHPQAHCIPGEHVLDEVGEVCFLSLRSLKIINITRIPFSMMAATSFVNLRCLVISPHNLGDDLVENIGTCQHEES